MKSGKRNVIKSKASREELAYDAPTEVDFGNGLVLRGLKEWRVYRNWRRQMAKLEPAVRKAFPDDHSVNAALKQMLKSGFVGSVRRRRSA